MNYMDYNYDLVKKEFPALYNSIEFNLAKILKKYNTNMYKLYAEYLATNKQNTLYEKKIKRYIYSLYLNSLNKEDKKELKIINKYINKLVRHLEFEFLLTFTETCALDIPPMQNNSNIINSANAIILRDNNGFYSNDKNIQDKIDNEEAFFQTLNSYLINKECIMSGERKINSKILTRKEILVITNYLGYGSIRRNILGSQTRNNEKVKTKVL